MDNPIISIIVPFYNSAETIELCVKSIQDQDEKDWELLLVDNGSTDSSLDIIKRLRLQDNRIIVISETQKGVSAARNAGLEAAKGDFVCFVDSDDTIDHDFLTALIANADSDLSVCGYQVDYLNKNGDIINSDIRTPQPLKWDSNCSKSMLTHTFENGFMHFCWNKAFLRSIIEDNKLRFKPYPVNEDFIFTMEYLKHVTSISIIDSNTYHWRRPSDKTTSVNSISDNLLSIYNHSHLLTRAFFKDDKVADRIAYYSYEMIIYKYYEAIERGWLTKKQAFNKIKIITNNTLVKEAYRAYKPTSKGEIILYLVMKFGWYKFHYFLTQKVFK